MLMTFSLEVNAPLAMLRHTDTTGKDSYRNEVIEKLVRRTDINILFFRREFINVLLITMWSV